MSRWPREDIRTFTLTLTDSTETRSGSQDCEVFMRLAGNGHAHAVRTGHPPTHHKLHRRSRGGPLNTKQNLSLMYVRRTRTNVHTDTEKATGALHTAKASSHPALRPFCNVSSLAVRVKATLAMKPPAVGGHRRPRGLF